VVVAVARRARDGAQLRPDGHRLEPLGAHLVGIEGVLVGTPGAPRGVAQRRGRLLAELEAQMLAAVEAAGERHHLARLSRHARRNHLQHYTPYIRPIRQNLHAYHIIRRGGLKIIVEIINKNTL